MPTPLPLALSPSAEGDLVCRLRAGEERAIAETWHEYAGGLLNLAYRLTGRSDDAEDVVQDLFVGLPEALQKYEERGQFLPWLRRITVRLALMRLRRGRQRGEVRLELAPNTTHRQPTDSLALEAALARLPDEQRTVVVLKVIEGYSHEEIAELLGIRRNASEVRLHRALARLRTTLEDR